MTPSYYLKFVDKVKMESSCNPLDDNKVKRFVQMIEESGCFWNHNSVMLGFIDEKVNSFNGQHRATAALLCDIKKIKVVIQGNYQPMIQLNPI